MKASIYLLVDPRSEQVRYVGKSIHPGKRLKQHVTYAARRNAPINCWVRSLLRADTTPTMMVIEEVPEDKSWEEAERFWIAFFRLAGADLLNLTDGGEGAGNPSAETRFKMGVNRGRIFGPEVRRRMSQARKGEKRPAEFCAAVSERNRGSVFTEERRRKIGQAHRGKVISQSMREALSRAHAGVSKTAEHREAIRRGAAARKARLEAEAQSAFSAGMSMSEMVSAGFSFRQVGRLFGTNHQTVKARIGQ